MRSLIYWPDRRLHERSRPLDLGDRVEYAFVERLIGEMVEVMNAHGGVGLSAVQIGEPVALVVVKDKKTGFTWYANPLILARHGEPRPVREGCLSAPGVFESIRRYPEVTVESERAVFDSAGVLRGERFHHRFRGLAAHVLQHEYEHLAGGFFLDHVSGLRRARAAAKLTRTTPR